MSRLPKVFVIVAGCLLIACGGARDGQAQQKAPEPSARAVKPAPATAGAPTEVTLISAGEEPRAPLRYRFSGDMRADMMLDLRMRLGIEMDGNALPETALPLMRARIAIDRAEVTPEGDLSYRGTWKSTDVVADEGTPRAMVKALEDEYAKLAGTTIEGVVTTRGIVKSARIGLSENASQQMRQMYESLEQALRQMMSPLPEEAVGKGAKWKVAMTVASQALTVSQDAIYTLDEIEGTKGAFTVTVVQTAPPQKMDALGLPAGASVTLESRDSNGRGTARFDLASLIPDMNMTLTSKMAMKVEAEGQSQRMKMSMRMDARVYEGK
jgi:hypothetical protein